MMSKPDGVRIGVFGGTFDPPHIGHLILASEAQAQLSLEIVLWVLTSRPPHKRDQALTPIDDRIELLLAAIEDQPRFQLSRVDIDRPAPHYAFETMANLHRKYPFSHLTYLMGADSLRDLPIWHRPRDFINGCDGLGIMRRPGATFDLTSLEELIPGLTSKIYWFDVPLLEISSTFIRARVRQRLPYCYYVTPSVAHLIQTRKLYQ
jgi:nicotinate-nucleotide adenylyltransferase